MRNTVKTYISALLALTFMLFAAVIPAKAQDLSEKFAANVLFLQQPFSKMDVRELGRITRNAEDFKDLEGYDTYKKLIENVNDGLLLHEIALKTLDSPFNFKKIVEVREKIINGLETEDLWTPEQYEEMDFLDIRLSRYKGAMEAFQEIITEINDDPDIAKYRKAAKSGRLPEADRRELIKLIGQYVYVDNTKKYDADITDYINLITYLEKRFLEYLNFISSNPGSTSPIEKEILNTKLQ